MREELQKLSSKFKADMFKHKEEMDSVFLNLMEQINSNNKEVDDLKSNYDGPIGTSSVIKPKTISNIVVKID